jgi:hypothetical protein
MRRWLLIPLFIVAWASAARAAEPGAGVAVLMLKFDQASVSQAQAQAFREAVRRAAGKADLAPLRLEEVDRRLAVVDLECTTPVCLARQAELLNTRLIMGGRIALLPGAKGWGLSIWVHDAKRKATLATQARACDGCSEAQALAGVDVVVAKLFEEAARTRGARVVVKSKPVGAQVRVDGELVGITDMTYGVSPGRHEVELRDKKTGASRKFKIQVGAGRKVLVEADMVPGGSEPITLANINAGAWKWVGLGLGLAGVAAGATLWALDGRQTCTLSKEHYQCPEQYDTLNAGVALTAVGAVVLAGTGLLFYLDADGAKDEPAAAPKAAGVAPWVGQGAGGVTAVMSF